MSNPNQLDSSQVGSSATSPVSGEAAVGVMRSPCSVVMQSADMVQSKSLGSAAIGILCAYKHAGRNIYI